MGVLDIRDLRKSPQENEDQYIWRIGELKDKGLIDMTWPELGVLFNKELRDDGENWTDSAYRKKYQYAKRLYDNVFVGMDSEEYFTELESKKREIEKLKKQVQTEKLEYNRWLREEARDELIADRIIEEVKKLEPLEMPKVIPTESDDGERSGILMFGDAHFGVEFSIPGLHGDIINEYSPVIFYKRMYKLLDETLEIIGREGFTEIYVFDLGDVIDGILRVKQLAKLKYGVVESTVKYADFMCNWLTELSKYVRVKFRMTHGNHSELRMLGQPKGTFTEDNMGEIVYYIISTRLTDNPNFEISKNETGLIFEEIQGFNVLGCHGQVKKLDDAIKDFASIYKTDIDLLVGAHLHHAETETVGVCQDVIRTPSIVGVDTFSMDLFKTSNPGATFVVIESGKGKVIQYDIKL